MNYFIDFEATQFSNDIISIGCVNEKGETFNSNVRTSQKVTPFITKLTGITPEAVKSAPTLDQVFSLFYLWINHNEPCHFYCYGTTDLGFVQKALKNVHTFEAQAALSLIAANLINYSPMVKNHFGLIKDISLIKVISYYHKAAVEQTHSAIEDAIFLKEIYDKVNSGEKIEGHPFPEYEAEINTPIMVQKIKGMPKKGMSPTDRNRLIKKTKCIKVYNLNRELIKTFTNFTQACAWLAEKIKKNSPSYIRNNSEISKKIIGAFINRTPYMNYIWDIQEQKGNSNE